jgi:hypothetical protein
MIIGLKVWNHLPKQQLFRYKNKINFSSTSSQSKNRSWNWGPPLSLVAFAGLGYFYFARNQTKKSDNPLDNLEKLNSAEVIFVLGGRVHQNTKSSSCQNLARFFLF